jgi:hypothetical protein
MFATIKRVILFALLAVSLQPLSAGAIPDITLECASAAGKVNIHISSLSNSYSQA